MLYSTERDLMSDHDATQPPTSGSPRPNQGDEFAVGAGEYLHATLFC